MLKSTDIVSAGNFRSASSNPETLPLIYRLPVMASLFTTVVSLWVLLGWQWNIEVAKRILPGLVAMNPLTAMTFILAATSLLLSQRSHQPLAQAAIQTQNASSYFLTGATRHQQRWLAAACAGLIALIGLLKLVAIIKGWNIPIDQLFFHDKLDLPSTAKPNRMAPTTAFSFLVLGSALLSLNFKTHHKVLISQVLALLSGLVSLLALIGYLYGVQPLYGIASYIPMAIHTATLFLLLALGLLCLHHDQGLMSVITSTSYESRLSRQLLLASIYLPIVLGWLRLEGQRAGYYDTELGAALFVVSSIVIFASALWWGAHLLHQIGQERHRTQEALRQSKEDLERKVVERTSDLNISNEKLRLQNKMLRQSDEELRLAKAEADYARQAAERASAAKSEFLSRLSHELRTPMNAILGFGQLLEMEQLTSEQEEELSHILLAGRHLLDLINEILDISSLQSNQLDIAFEAVPVEAIIRESMDVVAPLAAEKQVSMEHEITQTYQNICILADRQKLRRVLINLLSNAVKYNHQGGSLRVVCEETPENRLRINVIDSGPGITASDLEKIFQPFERLHAERQGIKGSGLDLVLSKLFVEAMQGTLTVHSIVGSGSTFSIELQQSALEGSSSPLGGNRVLDSSGAAGWGGKEVGRN